MGTIIGLESLTTVFGMGTGVTFPVCSPEEVRRTGRHGALNLECCKSGGIDDLRLMIDDFQIINQPSSINDLLVLLRALDKCGQAFVR